MAINRVEIKDFLVFKGEFSVDFCPGVNVLIGANATGKTTLMKVIYCFGSKHNWCSYFYNNINEIDCGKCDEEIRNTEITLQRDGVTIQGNLTGMGLNRRSMHYASLSDYEDSWTDGKQEISRVYIPEKDMLSNSHSLPETWESKLLSFNRCEIDIIKKSRVAGERTPQPLVRKIFNVIGGDVECDGQVFYIVRNGKKIEFSAEASGFRKLGLLAALIRNEQIKKGSILFWDEPENSLNPELVPVLVEILLELQSNGVQIFLATHNYNLARYFDIKKSDVNSVMFFNLSKTENGSIECVSSSEYTNLSENVLEKAGEKLFNAVVANAMGIQDDE
ncbi:MAG: AAA family ATPase [Synergistaceae bacterium]|jgi:predicted ATP-dependent endonuclease of OLD family|nr:AAA family ATPase [Synergistaceae bacterium]